MAAWPTVSQFIFVINPSHGEHTYKAVSLSGKRCIVNDRQIAALILYHFSENFKRLSGGQRLSHIARDFFKSIVTRKRIHIGRKLKTYRF